MGGPNDLLRRAERRAMIGAHAGRGFEALQLLDLLVLMEPLDDGEADGSVPPWILRRLHLLATPSAGMQRLLRLETRFGLILHQLLDLYLADRGLGFAFHFETGRLRAREALRDVPLAELRAEALRVVAEAGAAALPRGGGRAHALSAARRTGSANSPSSTTRVATQSSSL